MKRKAEEKVVEEEKREKDEVTESDSEGQRVVIEHW